MLKLFTYFLILCSFLFTACDRRAAGDLRGINDRLGFTTLQYQSSIEMIFSKSSDDFHINLSELDNIDTLQTYYSDKNFQPVVLENFEEQDLVYPLLDILAQADEHGLNSENYHISEITEFYFRSLNDSLENIDNYHQLAYADILLSHALMNYSNHIRYGVVNPKELYPDSYFIPVSDPDERDLFEVFKQDDIVEYLKNIQPANSRYKNLQSALQLYRSIEEIQWSEIPLPGKDDKIEPGDTTKVLEDISQKLITLGFIDTNKVKIKNYSVYNSLLVDAVKNFQRNQGLADDGVIGNSTVERLNISPKEYVEKIKINLERLRWVNYPFDRTFIWVNIPDFRLHILEKEKPIFDIKVCTGRKRPGNYTKHFEHYEKTGKFPKLSENWETVNLYGEISYMVLNPTWNVPESIIREEIFQKVSNDSTYLQTRNFKVYHEDGIEMNLDEITPDQLMGEDIPYRIIQSPGAGNALGKIKFMFNNPFGIYLHDTPTRRPFSYTNRAVSHGCVRVEEPLKLAEFVLRNQSRWNLDFLKMEIGLSVEDREKIAEFNRRRSELRRNSSYGKTTEVRLDKTIPLFIDYHTAWVDQSGKLNLRADVYNRDEVLTNYLTARLSRKGS